VPAPYLTNGLAVRLDQPRYFLLSWDKPSTLDSASAVQLALDQTVAGWRVWAKTCALPSFAEAAVLRSALCLKLHVFEETGAIIAAATTSIPEALGTERTWDYRYCWLRDAAFVVEALRRLSHLAEGEAFVVSCGTWPSRARHRSTASAGSGITEVADHLAGPGIALVVLATLLSAQQHDLMGEIGRMNVITIHASSPRTSTR
jgi:hypothetical protein